MSQKTFSFKEPLIGISQKTIEIHRDKLYAGYVKKKEDVQSALRAFEQGEGLSSANQTYSELRALKDAEVFAVNGSTLHEYYFSILGGNGEPSGEIVNALRDQFGSLDSFVSYFSGCGMSARGWVVLAWDVQEGALRVYTADAHNQGGVWGCMPILVLDVYEHAYFIDEGSDRKTYIDSFWKNVDWGKVDALFVSAKRFHRHDE